MSGSRSLNRRATSADVRPWVGASATCCTCTCAARCVGVVECGSRESKTRGARSTTHAHPAAASSHAERTPHTLSHAGSAAAAPRHAAAAAREAHAAHAAAPRGHPLPWLTPQQPKRAPLLPPHAGCAGNPALPAALLAAARAWEPYEALWRAAAWALLPPQGPASRLPASAPRRPQPPPQTPKSGGTG